MKQLNLKIWVKKHPRWSGFIGLIILITYPWFYLGSPIEGRVLDQEGNPLSGVVAVLQFSVSGTKNLHSSETRIIKGLEALTDNNGDYRFGWWVTPMRPIWARNSTNSPSIGFYKNGYKHNYIFNQHRKPSHWPLMYVRFKTDGEHVQLEKYSSLEKQKADWLLNHGRGATAWGGVHTAHFRCDWEVFPLYALERDKVIRRLREISTPDEYVRIGYSIVESELSMMFCSTPNEFFEKFRMKMDTQH